MKDKKVIRRSHEHLINSFPAAYVANGLNGTKTYKQLKPNVTVESARALAPLVLADLSVQERIRALLPSEEVESKVIHDAITAPIKEAMTWKDKHKYLTTSLQLKGLLKNNDDRATTNVAIVIDR